MSGSTNKKVIVERFEREPLKGFVNLETWLGEDGLELLSSTGNLLKIPYSEVKVVCFVKDLDGIGIDRKRKIFTTRPKSEGLWVRMLFHDGDYMDGVLANNLLQTESAGFTVAPPDPSANNQRVFVPRAALSEFKVLGVIGSRPKRRRGVPPAKDQIKLFE